MNNRLSNVSQSPPVVDAKVREIVKKHGLFPTPAIFSAIQEALQTNKPQPIPYVDMTEKDRVILVASVQKMLNTTAVIEILRDVSYGFVTLASSCKIPVNGTETVIATQHLPTGRLKVVAVCSLIFRGGLLRYAVIYPVSQKAGEIAVV